MRPTLPWDRSALGVSGVGLGSTRTPKVGNIIAQNPQRNSPEGLLLHSFRLRVWIWGGLPGDSIPWIF